MLGQAILWLILIFILGIAVQTIFLWVSAHFAYKVPLTFKTFKRSFIQWLTIAIIQVITFVLIIILIAIGLINLGV